MLEQINVTVRQSKNDPKKNTTNIPRVYDITDVGIITPRMEASLFEQHRVNAYAISVTGTPEHTQKLTKFRQRM